MGGIELAIFDFDDTLIHLDIDWPAVRDEILALAAEEGVQIETGLHLAVIANDVSKTGLKERIDQIFLRHETECAQKKSYLVFPRMASFVRELDSEGIKLAIASGNHSRSISEILSKEGLLESFDVICGRDKVRRNKPDPDQLLFIMERLDIPKDRTVFAGDSLNDEGAAKAAGIRYIKVDPKEPGDGIKKLRKLLL